MRQVAHKEYRGVANSIWKHSFLKDEILQKVYMDINKESSSLCSDKKNIHSEANKGKRLNQIFRKKSAKSNWQKEHLHCMDAWEVALQA